MVEYSDPRDFGFRPETVMTALMPYEQFSSKTRRLILGIDMGIASVGVCLIDIRNHEIVLMASHIFKAPVEGKQKDISARQSGASIRRGYRSVRRTTKRRKNRKKAVRDIEKKYILIPDDADGQWFAIRKGEPDVLHLRGKALLYKLNGRELARILYAFADRRGYIGHGKGATDDDSGKVKKALSVNRKILDENGYETIAQYLLKQPTSRNREGDYRYMVDIEMVTDEVHTIFRHQRRHDRLRAESEITWMASPISLNAGSLCPACANHVVFRGHNDLGTVNPNLSTEWHPIKNGSLTPADVVAGSTKRVWWQCSKGHEWKAQICERHRRNLGCPQCAIEARRIPIQCIETGDIYDSYASAAHAVGLKGCGGIAVACQNQKRTSGGYHWRLKE